MPPKPSPWPSLTKPQTGSGISGQSFRPDEDKIAKLGYHIAHQDGVAYIEEAETVLLCRKLSATRITADQFIDPEIEKKWYADGDNAHHVYRGNDRRVEKQ